MCCDSFHCSDTCLFSVCAGCRERFSRCQIHNVPDWLLIGVVCAFLTHVYMTKKFVPAGTRRAGADARLNITVPDHYKFVGGVGCARHDRRRRVGSFVNLVCGTAMGSRGWLRGYKRTQARAIAHILGHWPLPPVHNGAMWFDLDNGTPYGLKCLTLILSYCRHAKS